MQQLLGRLVRLVLGRMSSQLRLEAVLRHVLDAHTTEALGHFRATIADVFETCRFQTATLEHVTALAKREVHELSEECQREALRGRVHDARLDGGAPRRPSTARAIRAQQAITQATMPDDVRRASLRSRRRAPSCTAARRFGRASRRRACRRCWVDTIRLRACGALVGRTVTFQLATRPPSASGADACAAADAPPAVIAPSSARSRRTFARRAEPAARVGGGRLAPTARARPSAARRRPRAASSERRRGKRREVGARRARQRARGAAPVGAGRRSGALARRRGCRRRKERGRRGGGGGDGRGESSGSAGSGPTCRAPCGSRRRPRVARATERPDGADSSPSEKRRRSWRKRGERGAVWFGRRRRPEGRQRTGGSAVTYSGRWRRRAQRRRGSRRTCSPRAADDGLLQMPAPHRSSAPARAAAGLSPPPRVRAPSRRLASAPGRASTAPR